MGNSEYIDIFATKGIEYLVVIVFLVSLYFFYRFLNRPARSESASTNADLGGNRRSLIDWFYIAENYYYHQGHTWIRPEGNEIVSLGIDDFAQKLIGVPTKVAVPAIGANIGQGNVGLKMEIDSKWIDILSPVNGEVIEINEKVINLKK